MTAERRTQWIITAALGVLLTAAVLVGSRCERQDGDTVGQRPAIVAEAET